MLAVFDFSYDPDKILLRITQRGYWTIPIFRAYETEFLTHHAAIRRTTPHYRVLADCRDYPVQSAEIGEAFRILFEELMTENKGHYAIIIGSVLNKLQAKRALTQAHVQAFATIDEAMTWLFEEGSLPA